MEKYLAESQVIHVAISKRAHDAFIPAFCTGRRAGRKIELQIGSGIQGSSGKDCRDHISGSTDIYQTTLQQPSTKRAC